MKQKKQPKSQALRAAEEAALRHQLTYLGFKSVTDYKNWCGQHGFSTKSGKTAEQYRQECEFHRCLQKNISIEIKKKPRNIKRVLKDYIEKGIVPDVSDVGVLPRIPVSAPLEKKEQAKKFLLTLANQECLHEDITSDVRTVNRKFVHYINDLLDMHPEWVRDISNWKPRSHNTYRKFSSILRHFFCLYDIPSFMDKAWIEEPKYRKWYLHMGKGHNIRTVSDLPIPFTKRMAHCFCQAPSEYKIAEAIRYGQVLSLGGNQRLVEALRGTILCRDFSNEDFWESVIRWFIAQPMFDYGTHCGPVIDYLHNQKYVARNVIIDGVLRNEGPPQPGLSMKKRDPETLLRQVEEWHTQLGREKKAGNYEWPHSPIPDFEYWEGQENTKSRRLWTIRELCSSSELQNEGRKMRHCVSSYAHSCKSGRCTIWTLEKTSSEGKEKLLTIEVLTGTKQIVQARGKYNAKATVQELNIMQRWATSAGLSFSSYL